MCTAVRYDTKKFVNLFLFIHSPHPLTQRHISELEIQFLYNVTLKWLCEINIGILYSKRMRTACSAMKYFFSFHSTSESIAICRPISCTTIEMTNVCWFVCFTLFFFSFCNKWFWMHNNNDVCVCLFTALPTNVYKYTCERREMKLKTIIFDWLQSKSDLCRLFY